MRRCLLLAALCAAVTALAAGSATATVVPRITGVETSTSPYGFDQVSSACTGSATRRVTETSYAGSASLEASIETGSECSPYARGIFNANGSNHLVAGDDFWVGAAIYLPRGFWTAHTKYNDLIRVDSYVNDESVENAREQKQYIAFAAYADDSLHMVAAADTGTKNELVRASAADLPEGQWNWVEMHIKISRTNGSAVNELKINGVSKGSSTLANEFEGRAPYNRIRYGLVSADEVGERLNLWVDRAAIETSELGPITAYAERVLGTRGLVSYWRLGDASGTTATDSAGTNAGTYNGSPTLGATPLITHDANTAVSFDGVNDDVAVPASASLNPASAVSLEAWAKATALQGTVLRRNNSYELRMQSNGSILFRVWVGESVQSLESAAGEVTTGSTYHLVGTYDGAKLRIYKNGRQVAERAQTGALTNGANTLYIGFNDFSSTYFAGTIDEVALYNQALSAEAVADHYAGGTF